MLWRKVPKAAACMALVLGAGPSLAATLRVPSEYATLHLAVDAAASGDVVLVAPGTYSLLDFRPPGVSACLFLKTGVSVVSEGGPAMTALDLEGQTPPNATHVVYGRQLGEAPAVVEGFEILGIPPAGNAAVLVNGFPGGRVAFRDCVFRDLASGTLAAGIAVANIDLEVTDCEFLRCHGVSAGGILHEDASLYMSRSTFAECTPEGVLAISDDPNNQYEAVVEDCSFLRNTDPDGGIGAGLHVVGYGLGSSVTRCWFEDNVTAGGGAGLFCTSGIVVDCVFLRNRSPDSSGGALFSAGGPIEVRGCTFAETEGTTFFGGSAVRFLTGPVTFQNNIVHGTIGNTAVRISTGAMNAGCNIFWANAGGNAEGWDFTATDREVDPEFCDPAAGDLHVRSSSPCLPPNSDGCGLIGALGEGCGTVSVEPRGWSEIKGMYR